MQPIKKMELAKNLGLFLPEKFHVCFYNWYNENKRSFTRDKVLWNDSIVVNNYESSWSNCHLNCLLNSINLGIKLYTGIVIQYHNHPNWMDNVVHSFNVQSETVIDSTYYINRNHKEFQTAEFPFAYEGVEIPDEFINQVYRKLIKPLNINQNNKEIQILFPSWIVPYYLSVISEDYFQNLKESINELN